MFVRLLQMGNEPIGVGTSHKLFTALAFLTRDLASPKVKAKFTDNIIDVGTVKSLWDEFTSKKGSHVTIPVAKAVAALQKALPTVSRRQARQFQVASARTSARLFEERTVLKQARLT